MQTKTIVDVNEWELPNSVSDCSTMIENVQFHPRRVINLVKIYLSPEWLVTRVEELASGFDWISMEDYACIVRQNHE